MHIVLDGIYPLLGNSISCPPQLEVQLLIHISIIILLKHAFCVGTMYFNVADYFKVYITSKIGPASIQFSKRSGLSSLFPLFGVESNPAPTSSLVIIIT